MRENHETIITTEFIFHKKHKLNLVLHITNFSVLRTGLTIIRFVKSRNYCIVNLRVYFTKIDDFNDINIIVRP